MATVAALFSHLRRARPSSSLLYLPRVLTSQRPPPLPAPALPHSHSHSHSPTLAFLDAFRSRAFSTRSSHDRDSSLDSFGVDSPANSELLKTITDSSGGGEDDAVFPVRAVIWLLESLHDISGFPWWITIVSSTLALRIVILCPLILTLHKLKRIGEFFPKLPPPFPPPFSGKSYIRQFLFFQKKRKAIGCPSYAWPLVPYIVQVPCFFLWMISVRKMSLDGHPGFDCGGALWFQNLTELSHGYSGFIFPFLIAGLHYLNVQGYNLKIIFLLTFCCLTPIFMISFGKPLVAETRDIFDLLAKYYKRYLDFLTVPIAFMGFCIPQGSQLYWITNSSLTFIQHIALRHPAVLAKLGLQDKNRIPTEEMSPKELTALSVPFLNGDDKESAIPLLKLALDKDPEYVRALVLMGRVLLLKHVNDEANEYFERAISNLSLAGHPTDAEEVDLLILSSQWAGIACERQRAEGRAHFERIANMEEPEDPTSKGYYFDGLLLLASTLFDSGQKAEAAKYLRLVVAHKPAYKKFLDQCEQDDDIASDLARSRREL
uniref:Uncharacterized protein n=1 Tax=Cajanus cajan TaxID=3821 RepID=A0A151RYK8_CAJCA|nr:hypothetical protein KK1_030736 [Cajanus cajan]